MPKLLKGLVFGVLELWVRSFDACYGLRVAGLYTAEFRLQYFNPQPTRPSSSRAGTRNSKRFKYSNAPKLIEIQATAMDCLFLGYRS